VVNAGTWPVCPRLLIAPTRKWAFDEKFSAGAATFEHDAPVYPVEVPPPSAWLASAEFGAHGRQFMPDRPERLTCGSRAVSPKLRTHHENIERLLGRGRSSRP
jgi:hypothetical protein